MKKEEINTCIRNIGIENIKLFNLYCNYIFKNEDIIGAAVSCIYYAQTGTCYSGENKGEKIHRGTR
jgi:hypothetical protein